MWNNTGLHISCRTMIMQLGPTSPYLNKDKLEFKTNYLNNILFK